MKGSLSVELPLVIVEHPYLFARDNSFFNDNPIVIAITINSSQHTDFNMIFQSDRGKQQPFQGFFPCLLSV